METTYGDRLHKELEPSIDEFFAAITDTFNRGGNVIIPTFALERAQELLYFLSQGIAQIAARESGWQAPGHAKTIIEAGHPMTVKLTRPVPVYFSYLTAWAEGDGAAVFRPDIYGRDAVGAAAPPHDLDAASPVEPLSP